MEFIPYLHVIIFQENSTTKMQSVVQLGPLRSMFVGSNLHVATVLPFNLESPSQQGHEPSRKSQNRGEPRSEQNHLQRKT